MIGTVYLPPSNSRVSSIEIFDDIENEIYFLSIEYRCICLVSDYNSRVSTLKDFTDCDETFEQTCNPMSDIDFSLAVYQVDV